MTRPVSPRNTRIALLGDGALALSVAEDTLDWILPWLPRTAGSASPAHPLAEIRVETGVPAPAMEGEPAGMELYGVCGWGPRAGKVLLAEPAARVGAWVDLAERVATVRVDGSRGAPGEREVFATLTIATGLLLTRLERALVHAAAVVAPGGGAWILPGSSFSGKSTTCVTLIRGGWNYLCDDHVVLGADAAGKMRVEGWARQFHLDDGYVAGASQGVRSRVEPADFGPGRWQHAAPVAGLLFPRVDADLPTAVFRLHPAEAFARLLRQTPFVAFDREAVGPVLALLQQTAHLPAYELRLGTDTYCDVKRLQMSLQSVMGKEVTVAET